MKIINMYELLKNEKEKIVFEKCDSISFYCNKCDTHLITYKFKNNKVDNHHKQSYLYNDGDTIGIDEKYWKRVDTEMMFGKCKKCSKKIAEISINLLDKEIENFITGWEVFSIYSPDDIVKSFQDIFLYKICLENKIIGHMIFYKNAVINKEALHGIKDDIIRNIIRMELDFLQEDNNMNCGDFGVCNGHFKSQKQADIWKMASFIVEHLIKYGEEFMKQN